MWRSPKGLLIIGSVVLVLLLIYLAFTSDIEPSKKQDAIQQVEISSPAQIEVRVENTMKANEFIINRLPFEDGMFEMEHAPHGHPMNNEELIAEMMQLAYSAFAIKDIDALSVVFSIESLHSLLKEEQQPMGVLQKELEDFLILITRNDTIKDMKYQLDSQLGKENITNGKMYLSYSDGHEIEVPIQIRNFGDRGHRTFEIVTPLREIEKQLKQ